MNAETNVIKVRFFGKGGQPAGNEYTYYTPEPVAVGDTVEATARGRTSEAVVTAINVPLDEIQKFGDKAATILGKKLTQEDRERILAKAAAKHRKGSFTNG